MLRQQNLTPKKQFPGTIDISSLRETVKTVFFVFVFVSIFCCFFFSQNQFSVDRSRVVQILTCNLQITPSGTTFSLSRRTDHSGALAREARLRSTMGK